MVKTNNGVTTPKNKKETIIISDGKTEMVVEGVKENIHKKLKEKGTPDLRIYEIKTRVITGITEKMIANLPEGMLCVGKDVYILKKQSDELDKAYHNWCVINGLTMGRIDN